MLNAMECRTSRCRWRNRTGKSASYFLSGQAGTYRPFPASQVIPDSGILHKSGDLGQLQIRCQGHRDGRHVLGSEDMTAAHRYEVMNNMEGTLFQD